MDFAKIKTLDADLVLASKYIRILRALEWPVDSEDKFLQGWRKGNPQLPVVDLKPRNLDGSISILESIVQSCNATDPVEKYLAETALSYADTARMLGAVGTKDFTRHSTRIYGRPDTVYKTQGMSAVDGAKFFLEITDALVNNSSLAPVEKDISSEDFAGWLKAEVDEFFDRDTVEVIIDPNLSSKVLAGGSRIRLRGSETFSQLNKDQTLYHEAFIHTATILNGKKQLNLQSLGLGVPRTTRTQEGLAVLAELITNSMDINRLRRIALRVLAVKQALDGADFVEVFKFFLGAGQNEVESVRSTQRIFRGGDVKGGIVFTKDAVYLQGLLEVHAFMHVAICNNQPNLIRNLFGGRLTMADALRLDPLFKSGWLKPPAYMPLWATDLRKLAAILAYSAFASFIKLDKIYLERAIEFEEELKSANQN
jgi:uncharacterized protein (TIGR02421 family)